MLTFLSLIQKNSKNFRRLQTRNITSKNLSVTSELTTSHTYNHPYWFATGDHPNLWAVPELIKQFYVIVYNMQDLTEKIS